jgi:hypothetical protein
LPVYREHDFEIDQGDIFRDVPFVFRRGPALEIQSALGIVTSHGCDCERYTRERDNGADVDFLETYTVQVAPVIGTDGFDGGLMGDIRRGRVPKYFAISAEDHRPESLVDLHLQQPIPVVELLARERETSLSEESWLRLVVHIFVLQSRLKPEDVFTEDFRDAG